MQQNKHERSSLARGKHNVIVLLTKLSFTFLLPLISALYDFNAVFALDFSDFVCSHFALVLNIKYTILSVIFK